MFVGFLTLLITIMVVLGTMTINPIEKDLYKAERDSIRHERRIDDTLIQMGELKAENKHLKTLIDLTRKEAGLKGINEH